MSESGTRYGYGQDVGPDGTGTVVWSAPLPDDAGYVINARAVNVDGEKGTKRMVSEAAPGVAYASAYAPTVRYDTAGTATVVWLESTYSSDSCFAESGEGEEECIVDEYVRARQIDAGGSLSPVQELQHRQTVFPEEGSFGGTSPAYVTYGQPVFAGGPGETLTVLWPESAFGSGCATYGYSYSYADHECEADQRVKWIRLSSAGLPQGAARAAFESHTSGYGSGEPLLRLRAGAAGDGTVTVLFNARRSAGGGECWGGESSVAFFRIEPDGEAGASEEIDSGCGVAEPDLAVDPGGDAVVVWGWANTYSGDEALYARIDSAGSASAPQTLLESEDGASVSGLDVVRGAPGSALAVWAMEGSIRSRSISFTGPLGSAALVAAPPAGRYFFDPRLAAGPDGSAVLVWEAALEDGSFETALQATALDPDGIPHSSRTLMAPSRRDHGARVSAGPSGSFLASWRTSVPRRNRIQSARFGVEPADGNDGFADAQALDPELPSFASGSNVGATKETGEPDHAGDPGGTSVWFSWTAAESGPVTLATCASDGLDPALAVYTGGSLASLAPVAAAKGGAPRPCSEGDAGVRFDAVAGTAYRIAVDGEEESEGTFGMKLIAREDAPANDAFAAAKQVSGALPRYISGSNLDASREAGEPEHAGDSGGASVWYAWTAPTSGKTRISACGWSLGEPLLAVYTGSDLGSLTEVGSDASGDCTSVPFEAVAGVTYRIAVDGKGGREGRFQLRFVQSPANDDLTHAQVLSGPFASVNGSNVAASKETGEPDHAGDPGGASVWYSWTPSSDVTAVVSACLLAGKDESALLAIYTGSGYGDLEEVAADAGTGTTGCLGHKSEVRAEFAAGTKYLFALDGEGGADGPFWLSLEPVPANDDFADAQEMVGSLPQSLSGSTRHASKEPEEPNHAGDPGGASVWYSWTAPSNGTTTISTCTFFGSSLALGVYTGSDLAHLSEVDSDVGGGTGSCFSPRSEVQFDTQAGTRYYIAVDGPGGIEASFNLQLDLEVAATNDSFAIPEDLGSESWAFFGGSNRRASKEPEEPDHAGNPGGASVWFTWTAPETGTFGISTCSAGSLDPLLAVYTGSTLAGLQEVAESDDAPHSPCSEKDAKTGFHATVGTTYRIAVDGKGGSTGKFSLELGPAPDNDDFDAAVPLASDLPLSKSGSNRHASRQPLEPAHGGELEGASVWYSWTAPQAGEFEISTCSFSSLDPSLGLYTGSSLGSLTPVDGEEATAGGCVQIRFDAIAGTTYRIAVDGREGSEGSFGIALRGRPANDDFAAAEVLGGELPEFAAGDNRLASKEPEEPDHAGDPGGASVWFTWTPEIDETVAISTCSFGTLDPLLAVYTGSTLTGLQEVAANDDGPRSSCSEDDGEVRFAAVAGTTYRIAVDGKGGTSGPFELELRFGADNDAFADAQALPDEWPVSIWSSNRVSSKEAGEPEHAGEAGGASVWFTWTAPGSGTVKAVTCSSHFDDLDPVLAVYAGSSLAALEEVAANDDTDRAGCSAEDGEVRFAAVAGTTYWIAVDGKGGGEGGFQLQLSAAGPANDDFEDAVDVPQAPAAIAGNNAGAGVQPGEKAGAEQTVWYRLVADKSELVRLHTCSDDGAPMDLDVFTGSSLAGLDPVAPAPAGTSASCAFRPGSNFFGDTPVLAFEATAGTTYWISVDRYFQISPVFELQPAGPFQLVVDPPANDLRAGGELLPVRGGSFARSNVGATHEAEENEYAGEEGGASVWFGWFATADGPATVDTCGSAIDTLLAVEDFEGEVASSDDSEECGPGAASSSVTFEAEEGRLYGFAVDGKEGQAGQLQLNVVFETPDTTPPETQAFIPPAINTDDLTFTVFPDEPESSFECALDRAPFAPCDLSGPDWYLFGTISGLEEGPHTLAVREVDVAGNPDPTPVTADFEVDFVPPETTIASGPEGLTKELGPFTFSSDEPGGFECWVDESLPSFCFSPHDVPDHLADGDHVLHVRARDLAGNVDQTPSTGSFHLDRTPPVATIDAGPEETVESDTVSFEFSVNEPASFHCQLDERPKDDCESPRAFAGLGDGNHVFTLVPTDVVGNKGKAVTYDFRVENRPPQTEIVDAPLERVASGSAVFEFDADEPVSGFECSLDEAAFAACGNPEELSDLDEGEHRLLVRAIDVAGKRDPTPSAWTWTVDVTAPETTIAGGPTGLTNKRGPFTFGADEPVFGFECSLDEADFDECASGYLLPFATADGEHTLRVRAIDEAGNTDPTPVERTLTLDRTGPGVEILTPPPPVTGSSVVVEFELDVDATGAECRVDSQSFQPCASPIEFKGMPDGPHTISIRGVDSLGNRGPVASAAFTVDGAPPETEINAKQSDYFGPGPVEIGFHGSADAIAYECSLDAEPFTECSSPAVYEELDEGVHEFQVRALDPAGNLDSTPAELSFTVDTTAPETTITASPSGPVHVRTLPFEYESTEEPQKFECALDESEWRGCAAVLAQHRPGDHLFAVRAIDRAGNVDATPATQAFTIVNQDPVPTLALDRVAGPAPLTVNAEIAGLDEDGDPLGYSLEWGSSSRTVGAVPASGLSHTYTQPGVYLVRVELDDGFGTAVATQVVTVTLPEPLRADAGDDLTAVAGEPVVLDGTDSRPLAGIDEYRWKLTGGGSSSDQARFAHAFAEPGNYEAELTVSGSGGKDNDVALVHVVAPGGGVANVLTRHGATPLEGVQATVILPGGRRVEAISGNDGVARLRGLPEGSHKVLAHKSGYVHSIGDVVVGAGGTGSGEVELEPGETGAITVESRRMTLDEIEAAGIDTSDPANLHVYEFTFGGNFKGCVGSSGFIDCGIGGGGGGGGGCTGSACSTGRTTILWDWSEDAKAPILTTITLPARATFLKEFFDITVTVTNLAEPGITFKEGHASIWFPDGMSLAPTPTPQQLSRSVPDVPGGDSRTLHWILRGDVEGEYPVGVSYRAQLDPFETPIELRGETEEPIKVWGGSALKLKVDLDEEARDRYPFTGFVKLENVADIPVYNVGVELLQSGKVGYIEQPRQRHEFATSELLPGATLNAGPFILVPDQNGQLDLSRSFLRKVAGDVDLQGTIVTHDREPPLEATPELEGHWRNSTDLVLEWDPVPGAAGYEVYKTPDRQTEFGSTPLTPDRQLSPTKAMFKLDRSQPPFLALSSLVGGERKMVHPLLDSATIPTESYPSIKIEDESRCGDPKAYARVTIEDPDFELTGFGYDWAGREATPGAQLHGNLYIKRIEVPRDGKGKLARVSVAASNDNPEDATAKRSGKIGDCYYVGLGDSFSSGEGALNDGEIYEDGGHGCHRSPSAYPRTIRERREEMVFFVFKACSGAVSADLFNTNHSHSDEKEQAYWAFDAGLVTLSIGGNDLGFADILTQCIANYVLNPLPVPCKTVKGPEVESKLQELKSSLPEKLKNLRERMADNGRLILLGYPQIFPVAKPIGATPSCQALHPSDIAWMHDMVTWANQALLRIANQAFAKKGSVEFVDPNFGGRFDGRDVCSFGSYFNGIRINALVESFHPNEFGHEALAAAVEAKIDNPQSGGVRVEQGQSLLQSIFVETGNQLRATILWPGSDVELSLESPSGETIDRAHVPAGVSHELGPTSETYLVPGAEPGEWKVRAKGLEVDEGGEPVYFDLSQAEPETEPPLALFETSVSEGTAPLSVGFDASGSLDPAGQPLTYSWDFGDGGADGGVQPTHVFAVPGEYVTKLTVEDEDGERDSFETPILVKERPQEPAPLEPPGTGAGAPAPPAPVTQSPASRKPLKCRKGFKKKKVRGKLKCVKVKKKGRNRR